MAIENTKTKRGFTIIEVVLVLAIAGLIFLMVFIALPALQRSQRNTQRRDDYSMLVTAVNSYMSSNNGKLTNLIKSAQANESVVLRNKRWINSSGEDPNGNPYEVLAMSYDTWKNTGEKRPSSALEHNEDKENVSNEDGETSDTGSQVFIIIGANYRGLDTNNDAEPDYDPSRRAFAVYGYLEGGGYFCQDSGRTESSDSTQNSNSNQTPAPSGN